MSKPSNLSDAARAVLTSAAARDRIALPPERLPVVAQRAVVKSLRKNGLVEEGPAHDDQSAWRTRDDGTRLVLRVTDAGLSAIGLEPTTVTFTPPTSATRPPASGR